MIWEVLFWVLALCVCAAPFLPAVREWRYRTDAGPLNVSRQQDANIRHFAHSFFDQVNNFFDQQGIDPQAPPAPYTGEFRPGQAVAFLGQTTRLERTPDIERERRVRAVVLATGDLLLEGGLVYEQEIYCGGQLYAGSDATFRAVYVGTDLILGDRSIVARWLHTQGHAHIGRDSQIYGRVSSVSSITVAAGTRFERLNAPIVRTVSDDLPKQASEPTPAEVRDWIPPPALHRLDAETVLCMQSLTLDDALRIGNAIVCRGTLTIGRASQVSGNLKARRGLTIGSASRIDAALVCEGPIRVASGARIAGPIISETEIVLASGVIVGSELQPTTITAPRITLANGCQLSGSVWASEIGVVVDDAENA